MTEQFIEISCIELKQPIGSFYIGSINWDDLERISYSDVRRIENEHKELESYLGIQRPLSANRVKELQNYVNTIDATFPTSVILSINSENVSYDEASKTMRILAEKDTAKIIDGQHRIAGLSGYKGHGSDFQINATIFIDMDIEDQALVFSTINLKQEKVSKSLGYDLYEYANSRSPQKTSHNIAKLLNSRQDSPFSGKIKILGNATNKTQTLTQATFVESLIKYISKDPLKDRDLLKRGKKLSYPDSKELNELIFRGMFVNGQDAEIAKVIYDYFMAVKLRWPCAWDESTPGNILNRTTGFTALMRFLREIYNHLYKDGQIVTKDTFYKILQEIDLEEGDFTATKYLPGSTGQNVLFNDLLQRSQVGK